MAQACLCTIRHGTPTLFAALDVLEGTVLGRCMQRHRHDEFIRFLNAVEAAVPPGKTIDIVLYNYASRSHGQSLLPPSLMPSAVFLHLQSESAH